MFPLLSPNARMLSTMSLEEILAKVLEVLDPENDFSMQEADQDLLEGKEPEGNHANHDHEEPDSGHEGRSPYSSLISGSSSDCQGK